MWIPLVMIGLIMLLLGYNEKYERMNSIKNKILKLEGNEGRTGKKN